MPKLVYEISQAVSHLISNGTRDKMRSCATKAVAGKREQLQKHAAELAYCMIAPTSTAAPEAITAAPEPTPAPEQ